MPDTGLSVPGSLEAIQLAARKLANVVLPVALAHEPVDRREGLLVAYFHRALGTVRGLARLDQTSFLQLTFAGSRNLLEVLVDVALLANRQPDDAADRLQAWEDSTMLRAGEALVSYAGGNQERRARLAPVLAFVMERRDEILAARAHHWPDASREPNRWTGRSLLDDCKEVDRWERFDLEDFYETRVRRNNWLLHGSGFAGIRHLGPSDLDSLFCQSLVDSATNALRIALVVLTALGQLDPRLRESLERDLYLVVAFGLGHR